MAYSSSKNPFMDVSDDDFLASANKGRDMRSDPPPYEERSPYERQQQLKQQKMNNQLETTERCLASIYESERIGIATAEELVGQGEQLDNVEQKVDKINADTKVSQRHLNSIKSIFGGIKNWWSGEGKKDEASTPTQSAQNRSNLRQTIASGQDPEKSGTHPALRLRSDNMAGFYEDDVQEFDGGFKDSRQVATRSAAAPSSVQAQSSGSRSVEFQEYEKNLNKNIDLMSTGMSNLKSLAVNLGSEIEAQNAQLDRIAPKVDRADTKIRDQNRQMRQILGK